jgi:hypothetical protein
MMINVYIDMFCETLNLITLSEQVITITSTYCDKNVIKESYNIILYDSNSCAIHCT